MIKIPLRRSLITGRCRPSSKAQLTVRVLAMHGQSSPSIMVCTASTARRKRRPAAVPSCRLRGRPFDSDADADARWGFDDRACGSCVAGRRAPLTGRPNKLGVDRSGFIGHALTRGVATDGSTVEVSGERVALLSREAGRGRTGFHVRLSVRLSDHSRWMSETGHLLRV